MNHDVNSFKQEAERLFSDEILYRWKGSENVWRNGWALDTLLDYFAVCDIDASPYADTARNVLNPTYAGSWWDDFGWIGIAALRAAEQNVFPKYTDDFLKIAINAWAYMYGPGWSRSNTAIYPFTDPDQVPGWRQYMNGHTPNVGAPKVWEDIESTWPSITNNQKMERKPRYSPGGAWNSPITDANQPCLVKNYDGTGNYLNPIQNTVTNGLYAILTLRIYLASQNPAFSDVFKQSELDTAACLQAWRVQIDWFDQWMLQTKQADESLLLGLNRGSLVRERVSTFHEWNGNMFWDAAYRRNLAWTGDQGLLFGALREAHGSGLLDPQPRVTGLYSDIVEGVFESCYRARKYGDIQGFFLLPWTVIGSGDPFNAPSPGGDDGDYRTGNAVFMRYLLQANQVDSTLISTEHKKIILESAKGMVQAGFGKSSDGGVCDAYTPLGGPVDQMTAYVNRLSVLLLAIALSD